MKEGAFDLARNGFQVEGLELNGDLPPLLRE